MYRKKKKALRGIVKPKEIVLFNEGTDRRYLCGACDSGFDSETEVQIHRSVSHKREISRAFSKEFGCTVCLKSFATAPALRQHLEKQHLYVDNKHSKINRDLFICDECHYVFFNKDCLAIHVHKKHLGSVDTRLPCPMCAKHMRIRSVAQHMDLLHTRTLKTCPVCMEGQETIAFVPTHVAMEHPVEFACGFCRIKCDDEQELDDHVLASHERRAQPIGGRARSPLHCFTRLSSARARAGRVYYAERGLCLKQMAAICFLCKKIVYSRAEMVAHLSGHHGHTYAESVQRDAPSQPPRTIKTCHCGAGFFTEVLLKHHIFKVHTLGVADAADAPPSQADRASTWEPTADREEIEILVRTKEDTGEYEIEIGEMDARLGESQIVGEVESVAGESGDSLGEFDDDLGDNLAAGEAETGMTEDGNGKEVENEQIENELNDMNEVNEIEEDDEYMNDDVEIQVVTVDDDEVENGFE